MFGRICDISNYNHFGASFLNGLETLKFSLRLADTFAPKKEQRFLEAKYRQLPENPFHGGLQNVDG
jgi:hypothetical protein